VIARAQSSTREARALPRIFEWCVPFAGKRLKEGGFESALFISAT
jgi:hypothetical protein